MSLMTRRTGRTNRTVAGRAKFFFCVCLLYYAHGHCVMKTSSNLLLGTQRKVCGCRCMWVCVFASYRDNAVR